MFVYSEATSLFLSKVRSYIREILTQEMHITLEGRSFFRYESKRKNSFDVNNYLNREYGEYAKKNNFTEAWLFSFMNGKVNPNSVSKIHYIPYSVVVFDDKERLGFFDGAHYLIGLNKSLMYNAKITVIKNVLRHELAHFIVYLKYLDPRTSHYEYKYGEERSEVRDHGWEFKEVCRDYKWDSKDVITAYGNVDIQNENLQGDLESEKIISKVKKLFALTQSSNQHEAELATLKANQLLIKYNLQGAMESFDDNLSNLNREIEDFAYVKRVLSVNRTTAKMRAIAEILRNFLGDVVIDKFCHSKNRHFDYSSKLV